MIEYWILLVMLFAVHQTHQKDIQQPIDKSFQKFCDSVGGTRSLGVYSEKCSMHFEIPSKTPAEAALICKTWNAYHLVKSSPNQKTTNCEFENLYACDDGWTQIRGMCYKYDRTDLTYQEATEKCRNDKKSLFAKLPNYEMSRLFDSFFPDLTMFFIQNSPGLEDIHTFSGGKGPHYVLIYGLATVFRVGYNSIMKIDGKMKAHAMCEYKPPETLASVMMRAKAFEPYYYPVTMDGRLTAIRTNSFYAPSDLHASWKSSKDFNKAGLKCQASLKPIIGDMKNEDVDRLKRPTGDGFRATLKNAARLSAATRKSSVFFNAALDVCHRPQSSGITIHSPYFAGAGVEEMIRRAPKSLQFACKVIPSENALDYVDPSLLKVEANDIFREKDEKTLHLLMGENVGGEPLLKKNFRDHYAPIMCRLDEQLVLPDKCPDGYAMYDRAVTGEFVCHKYYPENLHRKDAHARCDSLIENYIHQHLSSITDKKEFELLLSLTPHTTWIDLLQKPECHNKYNPKPKAKCSLEDGFYWQNEILGLNGIDSMAIVRELWGFKNYRLKNVTEAAGAVIAHKGAVENTLEIGEGIWPATVDNVFPYLCAKLAGYGEH